MADAVAQRNNLAQAQQSGLLRSKRFEILLSNAKNEPLLTLEHLHSFIGSLAHAFKVGSEKAHNPDPSVLKIIAGSETITYQDIKFAIDGLKSEDVNIPGRGLPYIKNTLYPEDVIAIIGYLRQWLVKYYAQETREYSWTIEVSTLEHEWRNAVERKDGAGLTNSIADFSQRELQEAVEELLERIEVILKAKTADIEHDSIDELIDEIKERFAREPEKVWQDIGLVLTKALAESATNSPTILIPDKNLKVADVRLAINVIYDQVAEQIEKEGGPEKPWDRASDITRVRFSSRQAPYFSVNEIQEANVTINDTIKADSFIERIDQLLEELKQQPIEVGVAAEEPTADDGGGEPTVEEEEQLNFLTQEEIVRQTIDSLAMRSGESFFSYFSGTNIDPNQLDPQQRDWLLAKLPEQIRGLLDRADIREEVENKINDWIITNLTPEGGESNRYGVGAGQLAALNNFLAEQFFAEYASHFLEWMETVPTTDELETVEPVEVETPPDKAVVPPAEAEVPEPSVDRGEAVNRGEFIRDTTTSFLGLHFGTEGEAFRKFIFDYVAENTPETLTTADLLRLRLKLFSELQLNQRLYDLTQNHYQQRLKQLGLDDAVTLTNFYNTLDSILVLIEDPHEYLAQLTEEQIVEYFGLEGTRVNIDELRAVLMGMIFVRRAHYFITRSTPIKPWLGKKKKEQASQRLGQLRSFVKATGEEGVMALNLDEEGINESTISAHRKEVVRSLYQKVWLNTIAGKSPEELMEIYLYYGVDVIEIDFTAPPVPAGFIYSDMAQGLNLETPTAAQTKRVSAAKQLFAEGKQKLGKLALAAVAPELAPILATLEQLPIIGAALQDIEEKTGDLLIKMGAVLGVGLATLIGFLTKSIGAAIGTVAGSVLGGFIGSIFGPWGTAAGILIGGGSGGVIGYNLKAIGNWFRGLGGGGSGVGVTGGGGGIGVAKAGAGFGLGGPAIPTAVVPATLGGGAFLSWVVISSTGASIQHPITNFTHYTTDPGTGEASPYVQIIKEANPRQLDSPGAVTYAVTIAARGDYSIEITDVTDELEIRYNTDKYPGGVPSPGDTTKTIDDFPELEAGTIIGAGEIISLTYTTNYTEEFNHANIVNYFTLAFNYSDGSESGSAETMSLTSVKIGEAPEFGGCWPVAGEITQLPFGGYSHKSTSPGYGADGIDIAVPVGTPVYASFGGTVVQAGNRGNYGKAIVISGDAGSFIYAHLSAIGVNQGDSVDAGDVIGLSGNTGASSKPHLHYERGNSGGAFYATPLGSGSVLLQLHEAIGLKEGDIINRDSCGS